MDDEDPVLGAYVIAPWLRDPELLEDLKRNYVNFEVFGNPDLEQIYNTGVRETTLHYSTRPPADATIVYAQINGKALPFALREAWFFRLINGPQLKEIMQDYGATTFAELRTAIQTHPTFPETDKTIAVFFIRHFPRVLRSAYEILADVAICTALLRSEPDKKAVDRTLKLILKRNLGKLERDLKRMIGTRKRGGSEGKLETNKRQSLHIQYDALLRDCKAIKRHYKEIFQTFEQNKHNYKRDDWRKFWLKHAAGIYNHDSEFLDLFSEVENQSASDIAYRRLSQQTGHAVSYVKRLVIKSRKPKKVILIRVK